jgi:hypothetical protein
MSTKEELRIKLSHAKTRLHNRGIPMSSPKYKFLQESVTISFRGGKVQMNLCRPSCYSDDMFTAWIRGFVNKDLGEMIDGKLHYEPKITDFNYKPVLLSYTVVEPLQSTHNDIHT